MKRKKHATFTRSERNKLIKKAKAQRADGYSQKEIADDIGVHFTTVARWLRGGVKMRRGSSKADAGKKRIVTGAARKLDAVTTILKVDLPAEERIALALMTVGE